MLGLDGGDTRAVDTRHLPGPDTDGHTVTRINYGVGFDELGYLPGEHQILHLLVVGLHFTNHFETLVERLVGLLNQYPAVDMLVIEATSVRKLAYNNLKSDVLAGRFNPGSSKSQNLAENF